MQTDRLHDALDVLLLNSICSSQTKSSLGSLVLLWWRSEKERERPANSELTMACSSTAVRHFRPRGCLDMAFARNEFPYRAKRNICLVGAWMIGFGFYSDLSQFL